MKYEFRTPLCVTVLYEFHIAVMIIIYYVSSIIILFFNNKTMLSNKQKWLIVIVLNTIYTIVFFNYIIEKNYALICYYFIFISFYMYVATKIYKKLIFNIDHKNNKNIIILLEIIGFYLNHFIGTFFYFYAVYIMICLF